MRDYDSNDVETAAYLAADDAEPDYDVPTRAELAAEEYASEMYEPYCDFCEETGHTFRTCPQRDDEFGEQEEGTPPTLAPDEDPSSCVPQAGEPEETQLCTHCQTEFSAEDPMIALEGQDYCSWACVAEAASWLAEDVPTHADYVAGVRGMQETLARIFKKDAGSGGS